jgi:hypothetical protein
LAGVWSKLMGRVGKVQTKKTGAHPMRAVARFDLAAQPCPSGRDSTNWNPVTRSNLTNLKKRNIKLVI